MAQGKNTWLQRCVEGVISAAQIEEMARQQGVLRRRRKLEIVLFVRTLVLGFGAAGGRSMSEFRRLYQRISGVTIARSSFHQRFTSDLAALMMKLLEQAIASSRTLCRLDGAVGAFREVLAIDSSIVRVSPELKKEWPGVWANHSPASVKITAVTNVVGRDLRRIKFSPGSRHDVHLLDSGKWLKDRLIVFDLGFFKAELFKEIDAAGGYFLCRLKKQSNPWIIGNYDEGGANLIGKRLKEAQKESSKSVIDVEAKMTYQVRPNKNRKYSVPFRVVALRSASGDTWHRYVTNAPPEMLAAKHLSAVYAARWEIELLFKELKSQCRMEEFRSKNGAANLCFIAAALLSLVVSRRLQRAVSAHVKHRRIPHDRWSKLYRASANEVLSLSVTDRPNETRALLNFWISEAPDPNRNRPLLAERSSMGVCAFG